MTSEPSREMQLRNHVVTTAVETMEIRCEGGHVSRVTCGHVWCGRVELGEDQGEEQAVVLCCLSFTAGGILTVSPDFSWSGRPYRLEVARCTASSLVTRVRRSGAGRCWSGASSTSAATWRPPASCGRPRCSTRSR